MPEHYRQSINTQHEKLTSSKKINTGLRTVAESKRGSIEFYRLSGDQSVTPKPSDSTFFNNIEKSRAAKMEMHKTGTVPFGYGLMDRSR